MQWGIKCNEIIDKFNFKGFQIINDAETIAFGVLNVEKENLIKINTAEEIPNKTKLIIIVNFELLLIFLFLYIFINSQEQDLVLLY